MSEAVEKKGKPSARTFVSITLAEYKPGMETDPDFCGVMFRQDVAEGNRVDSPEATKARNSQRMDLSAAKCKQYGVKPLGATSAPAGGITNKVKDLVKALGTFTKDIAKIIQAVKASQGRDLTPDEVKEILG